MNTPKPVLVGIATAFALALAMQSASGQDFKAFVNEVRISTNHNGNLVYERVNNADIIKECAKEKGITNLTGLTLVYNRTADALEVIRGTNLTAICTPLKFSGGTWLINSNNTKAERLAFVMVETNTATRGTLAATERFAFGPSNELTFFLLSGQLQYSVPASGTNPPAIFRGRLSAGMGEREPGEEGEQGEHGEHHGRGHHGDSDDQGDDHD